jgi:hypothetical protein
MEKLKIIVCRLQVTPRHKQTALSTIVATFNSLIELLSNSIYEQTCFYCL